MIYDLIKIQFIKKSLKKNTINVERRAQIVKILWKGKICFQVKSKKRKIVIMWK